MLANRLFLDSSFIIALSSENDELHERALDVAGELDVRNSSIVTTGAVLLEVGNAMSRKNYRKAATKLLDAIQSDARVEIIPLTDSLFSDAFDLYKARNDKEWGLTDCASFVVMKDHGLIQALTADKHFKQAGFEPVLLND